MRGFLSIDIDISDLHINQCEMPRPAPARANQLSNYDESFSEIDVFHNSNKCHEDSMQVRTGHVCIYNGCWME